MTSEFLNYYDCAIRLDNRVVEEYYLCEWRETWLRFGTVFSSEWTVEEAKEAKTYFVSYEEAGKKWHQFAHYHIYCDITEKAFTQLNISVCWSTKALIKASLSPSMPSCHYEENNGELYVTNQCWLPVWAGRSDQKMALSFPSSLLRCDLATFSKRWLFTGDGRWLCSTLRKLQIYHKS